MNFVASFCADRRYEIAKSIELKIYCFRNDEWKKFRTWWILTVLMFCNFSSPWGALYGDEKLLTKSSNQFPKNFNLTRLCSYWWRIIISPGLVIIALRLISINPFIDIRSVHLESKMFKYQFCIIWEKSLALVYVCEPIPHFVVD